MRFFSGKLIGANVARGRRTYHCPFCHKPMKLHISTKSDNFFTHYKYVKNCGGQTSEHKQGKLQIAKFFQPAATQICIEKYLSVIKQRPDILFGHSVIEYQCSPITTRTLHKRLKGYKRLQLKSFWILGPRYFHRHLRSRYLSCFMRYSKKIGFYLAFWSTSQNCLIIRYFYRTLGKHLFYQEQKFYTYQTYFNFMQTKQFQVQIKSGNWQRELNDLRHDLFQGSKHVVKLQWFLNQKGLNLEGCPPVCFSPFINPPVFGQYVWVWHLWIIYFMQESNQLWQIYRLANRIMGFPCKFQQIKAIHCFYKIAYLQFMKKLQQNRVIIIKDQKIIKGDHFQWKQSYFDNLNSADHRG